MTASLRFLPALVLTTLAFVLAGCEPNLGRLATAEGLGFGGAIVLALAVYALINILGSNASTPRKVLWTLLVFFLPLLGFLIWLFAGPRRTR